MQSLNIINYHNFNETIFLGELSLDGNINPIKGVLPICIEAKKFGIKRVFVPVLNANEASIVSDLEIIKVTSLQELILYLTGKIKIENTVASSIELNNNANYDIDFSEVKGQQSTKRALEIAVAGNHNCLLIGSPGSRENNDGKKSNNNFT